MLLTLSAPIVSGVDKQVLSKDAKVTFCKFQWEFDINYPYNETHYAGTEESRKKYLEVMPVLKEVVLVVDYTDLTGRKMSDFREPLAPYLEGMI